MAKILIVGDDGNIINFETVTEDTVSRAEVAEIEAKIASNDELIAKLQAENVEFNAKLEKARKIIELADAKKAEEQEEVIAEEEVQAVESVQVEEVE